MYVKQLRSVFRLKLTIVTIVMQEAFFKSKMKCLIDLWCSRKWNNCNRKCSALIEELVVAYMACAAAIFIIY